jgi:histone acetyltransferase SAS3
VDAEINDQNVARESDSATAESPRTTRGSAAPKVARDLLPSQRGNIKADSHSVFNQLVLDEDPLDGSRILRKRKTSSVDIDDNVMSLRKRRKNTSDELELEDAADAVEDANRPQSARSLRLKVPPAPLVLVVKKTRTSLLLKFKVPPTPLRHILAKKPKGPKKSSSRPDKQRLSRPGTARSAVHVASSMTAPFAAGSYSQPFYSFFDRETDELKGKPYGGILNEAEADTSKTLPSSDDRRRFDEAKQKAEEEWRARVLALQEEMDLPVKKPKKQSGPASQIECIEFGGCEIDTWYAAPYPEEYSRNRVLHICEFCLKYMTSSYVAWRHKLKCPAKFPPGDEIYRHRSISIFEVDGRKHPVYCQNLCLLAKLFLGSKTLYYDVEPFLFYVLCEYDELGYHFVGYFSKEKRASSQNNVSCILTLPSHQRKGYGNLLIDFSYLLTRVEEKTGSPEKPLSDMGLVSYRNYWRLVMCRYLLKHTSEDKTEKRGLSIRQISDDTGLTADDVVAALEGLRCLVRDPQTGIYAFRVDLPFCREYVAKWDAKNYVTLKEQYLVWTPYVMGRSNATNFELGPALTAIAPREEEEVKVEGIVTEPLPNGDILVTPVEPPEADLAAPSPVGAVIIPTTEPEDPDEHEDEGSGVEKPLTNGVLDHDGPVGQEQLSKVVVADSDVEGQKTGVAEAETETGVEEEEDWTLQYDSIPVTRFVVYPPISARRVDRPRPSAPRPGISRTTSSSRPRNRTSSVRRSAVRPKSSSSRKRTGGTGRGPGRWPKGTKKSDYGNADSGPGFPPGWLEARGLLNGEAANGDVKDEDNDSVQVQTPTARLEKRNGLVSNSGKSTPRSQRSKVGSKDDDGDILMEED